MSTPLGKLTVLAGKNFACVKIAGRANFTLSIDFQSLVNELHKHDYPFVVIDLSECLLMDSTFLGTLTGFGLKMGQPNGQSDPRVVELLNANARIAELLENLGVLHLFKTRQGQLSADECVMLATPAASSPNQADLTRACLDAHQTLMALNAENATKFKDVARFLADELQKHKSAH